MSKLISILKEQSNIHSALTANLSALFIQADRTPVLNNYIEKSVFEQIRAIDENIDYTDDERKAINLNSTLLICAINAARYNKKKDSYRVQALAVINNLIEYFEKLQTEENFEYFQEEL